MPRRRLNGPASGLLLVLGLGICIASSQAASLHPLILQSRTGQFTVAGVPMAPRADTASAVIGGIILPVRGYLNTTSSVSFVRLDPSLVAVSCEEIKTALLKELGAPDQWKGPVRVLLHPIQRDDEPTFVTTTRHAAGWGYEVEMPDQMDRSRFIKSIVLVLLSEMANRQNGGADAELPPWLANGLASHLEATTLMGLALELQTGFSQRKHARDPVAQARAFFNTNSPLSIDQMDWPTETQRESELYRHCSHLLVHELLRLKTGRACLLRTIQDAHQNLNWQTTFFTAFNPYFPRLLDFDKWWTLRTVQFKQAEPFAVFKSDEQWRQLDDILMIHAAEHASSNQLPVQAELTLQQVITDFTWQEQKAILGQKLQQLQAVEVRTQMPVAGIVEQYQAALSDYLRKHGPGSNYKRNLSSFSMRQLAAQTVKRLNNLDVSREQMKKAEQVATAAVRSPEQAR